MLLACLLYHTRSTEHVARTDTLHLDTYSMSAGKISGTHGGEKGAGTPPGRPASDRSNRERAEG